MDQLWSSAGRWVREDIREDGGQAVEQEGSGAGSRNHLQH